MSRTISLVALSLTLGLVAASGVFKQAQAPDSPQLRAHGQAGAGASRLHSPDADTSCGPRRDAPSKLEPGMAGTQLRAEPALPAPGRPERLCRPDRQAKRLASKALPAAPAGTIGTLPTITVRPDAVDLAYYRSVRPAELLAAEPRQR